MSLSSQGSGATHGGAHRCLWHGAGTAAWESLQGELPSAKDLTLCYACFPSSLYCGLSALSAHLGDTSRIAICVPSHNSLLSVPRRCFAIRIEVQGFGKTTGLAPEVGARDVGAPWIRWSAFSRFFPALHGNFPLSSRWLCVLLFF